MSSIYVVKYDHSLMFNQVRELFINEYGVEHIGINGEFFEKFYNSYYQKDKAIALVAMCGQEVCGFQAFFYWPFTLNGRTINSYQSGNSLVSPKFRGRGIFGKLLSHIESEEYKEKVDFVIGFPVEMSYGSFIRMKWSNPLDLQWFVKIINPASIFNKKNINIQDYGFTTNNISVNEYVKQDCYILSGDSDFVEWRRSVRSHREQQVYYFYYRENDSIFKAELKLKIRGRIKELIIGGISTNIDDEQFLKSGFNALVKKIKYSNITILSICLNKDYDKKIIEKILHRNLFFQIKKKIYFIYKNISKKYHLDNINNWKLFMIDVDTW